jgi:hypothetical protein
MLPKSQQEKPTTGAPVDEVKINPFVTARTRELNFNQQPLPLKKRKQFIYAAARNPGAHHSAMAAIINKTAGVINVESTI